jgi:hypothetical protein
MAEAMNPPSQPNAAAGRIPGLVMFAAAMMFLLGGFHIMIAIEEFVHATWLAINVEGTVGGPLWLWGIIDAVFAVIALYAGYDLLRGGVFGRIAGLIVASVSAIRWFFYIPAAPLLAVVVIVADVLIIYGLTVHSEYFGAAQRRS